MALWHYEVFEEKASFGLKAVRQLFSGRSQFQTVDIIETELWGKVLVLDGLYQTSVGEEYYYHEMLNHPALVSAPKIERVLVIGGGDGGSIREVLSYPEVIGVTMVEIDGMVIDACRKHLPEICQVWDDPRLDLRVGDGIAHVAEHAGSPYDVIIVDGSDPVGPAAGLFNLDFYRNCFRQLGDRGVLVVQSGSPHLMTEEFRKLIASLRQVFPRVHPYFAPVPIYPCGGWSYTYASKGADPFNIVESRVERAEKRCRYYNRDIHRGAFAVPNEIKPLLR